MRKKRRYEGVRKFTERIKEVQEEAKTALAKVQEDIKQYIDRHRSEAVGYKVENLVLLSTKGIKWQIIGQ